MRLGGERTARRRHDWPKGSNAALLARQVRTSHGFTWGMAAGTNGSGVLLALSPRPVPLAEKPARPQFEVGGDTGPDRLLGVLLRLAAMAKPLLSGPELAWRCGLDGRHAAQTVRTWFAALEDAGQVRLASHARAGRAVRIVATGAIVKSETWPEGMDPP